MTFGLSIVRITVADKAKVMYHILDEMLANKCVKEADQILPLHWEA